jgi:hypothetical protein
VSSAAPPPPSTGKAPAPGERRIVPLPRRERTWKDWLVPLPALAVTAFVFVMLVRAGRSVPVIAYGFGVLALLALALDVYILMRGRSMILVMGVIFAAAAVVSLVPRLAVGIPLAVAAAAGYVGLMLLIAFRKRA